MAGRQNWRTGLIALATAAVVCGSAPAQPATSSRGASARSPPANRGTAAVQAEGPGRAIRAMTSPLLGGTAPGWSQTPAGAVTPAIQAT